MKETRKYFFLGLVFTSLSIYQFVDKNDLVGWLAIILFGLLTIAFFLKLIFPNANILKSLQTNSNTIDNRPFEEIYEDNGIFEYEDNGFKINFDDGLEEIKWENIQTIFGYKLDLYTTDCICAEIFLENNKNFRITEETKGWFQFLIHLKEKFPNIDSSWEINITTPVFETQLTLVYDKENRTLEELAPKYYKD